MTGVRPRPPIGPTFLVELLVSGHMKREIEHKTDAGTILNALNVKSIPSLRFVFPPPQILTRFEETARPLRAAMEANLGHAASLAEIRDTLLPRLISGKLRLNEAETMSEDALA